MMGWNSLYMFAMVSIGCWLTAAILALANGKRQRNSVSVSVFQFTGIIVLSVFIVLLTVGLQRPPLQTLGEIRLWYAFFLVIAGWITFYYWRFSWILLFTTVLSSVFLLINIFRPEIHHQTLPPALQSFWFIPHVILYMFSYALLACTFLIALIGLVKHKDTYLQASENLTVAGVSFFTVAMLMGSLWAKVAWGHYWTWDAKELWAALTWMVYLFYLQYRNYKKNHNKTAYWILIVAFVCLQMCWYGIYYFPSQHQSFHTYF